MELIFHSLINVAKKQRKVNYTSSSIVFVIVVTYVTTRTNKKKHKAFVTHNPSHKRWRRAIKLFTLSVFVCLSVTVLCQACLLHFFLTIPRSLFSSMAAWDLSVTVEDLGLDAPPVTISVASDLHIGGVILKLVEKTRG